MRHVAQIAIALLALTVALSMGCHGRASGSDAADDDSGEPENGEGICGDGTCDADSGENYYTCARDCSDSVRTAVFVQPHMDDEILSFGRIYDLVKAGHDVYVIWPLDSNPILEAEGENHPLARLGIPADRLMTVPFPTMGMNVVYHDVLDWLQQTLVQINPDEVYIQQYCGSHLEHEMTHVFVLTALKRAGLQPEVYETSNHSYYYFYPGTMGNARECHEGNEDEALQRNIDFERLLPKSTPEIKVMLTDADLEEIRQLQETYLAHIDWMRDLYECLGEERVKELIDALAAYRALPEDQSFLERPFESSPANPDGVYYYEAAEPGFYFEDYRNMALLATSQRGCDAATIPSTRFSSEMPHVARGGSISVPLVIYNFGPEADHYTLTVAEGDERRPYPNASLSEYEVDLGAGQSELLELTVEDVGDGGEDVVRVWIRIESERAAEHSEPIDFTEVRFGIVVDD